MIEEPNIPWDTMCSIVTLVRDFFAAVGIVCTLAFLVGYFWGKI